MVICFVLQDVPAGCVGNLTSGDDRLNVALDLLLRDLQPGGTPLIATESGQSNVCYELIEMVESVVRFTHRCCHYRMTTSSEENQPSDASEVEGPRPSRQAELLCSVELPNKWLYILDGLLPSLFVLAFVFGAAIVPSWLFLSSLATHRYVVKLKKVMTVKTVADSGYQSAFVFLVTT
jgi:hypothetical protein